MVGKIFGGVIIFLLIFAFILLLIGFLFLRKFFLRIRQHLTGDYDDETFKKMADKHYRDYTGPGQQFERDYFKGAGTTQGNDGSAQHKWKQQREQQKAQQSQRRTTQTSVQLKSVAKSSLRTRANMLTSPKRNNTIIKTKTLRLCSKSKTSLTTVTDQAILT